MQPAQQDRRDLEAERRAVHASQLRLVTAAVKLEARSTAEKHGVYRLRPAEPVWKEAA